MKVLIFGASGMIGHMMFRVLSPHPKYQVFGTLRGHLADYEAFHLFSKDRIFESLDVLDQPKTLNLLNQLKPDVILNAIGITLRKPEIKDETRCKKINSEFPQFLKGWVEQNNSYLIHFSTDCVFSGKTGPYTEESLPDAEDIYGRTKAAGEVNQSPRALTLRGSMIGRELTGKTELLEWALLQKGRQIKGFSKAMYSGVTTSIMAELVVEILSRPEKLKGLYQVSSQPISKYHLLQLINEAYHLKMQIQEDSRYASEKVLICEKIKRKLGFDCPDWSTMVKDLSKDLFKYFD